MDNKNQRVLTIIIVATALILVIIFAGVTYAFFTANNPEGSTAQIISENGRMIITYDDGTDSILPVTNIQPSNTILVNKTFSLKGTNTTVGMSESDGLTMPYKVGVQYTSGFSNGMMHYYIKSTNKSANVTEEYTGTTNQTVQGNPTYTGYTHGTFKKGNNKYTEMVTGEFPASLNNQTITFNLIIQFPDNNENQDSEKGKTFNGKIVINYEPPKPTTFANDSWSDIAMFVNEGELDAYPVGSEKEVEINGTSYTARVANNTTSEKCSEENFSETACGFVIEFVDIVETRTMNLTNSNVGGWPVSELRTYLNGDFYNNLPEDLRNVIIDTKVISGYGYGENTNFVSTDKIYLLSAHEVFEEENDGSIDISGIIVNDTAYDNTRQLDFYLQKGITTSGSNGIISKNYSNSQSNWWLRTPYHRSSSTFYFVRYDGIVASYYANNESGVAPAFRIG